MQARPFPSVATAALSIPLLLAWEASGGDRLVAGLAGGPLGFAWREHWLLTSLLHEGGRRVSWALVLALSLGVWWPVGPLRQLDSARRMQLAATPLAAALAVALPKGLNATSCPWDLADFGGVAQRVDHWIGFLHSDGGSGHCFPAGHASAGFCFFGGYFVFRTDQPALARAWFAAALLAGLVFGLAQQWRGAHFMSHTLWSGWLCWVIAGCADLLYRRTTAASPVPC
ncbi:phosphatase PAP2 family protein [Aquincola sp. S2]|uniref:Phosphatase PAP2 family protein n=1 Tax=Pseudaquabacterium terrae TaxID=2732868 RepID=A0ABX2ETC6_9BURK|nr:phosphatase PAP2 family protein [Aquabacterium terrae]NRF71892.1 phosphatase PAP2 family protein [Aquabacterium terrae]